MKPDASESAPLSNQIENTDLQVTYQPEGVSLRLGTQPEGCLVSIVLNPPRNLNAARLRAEAFVKTSADCPADPKLVSDLHGFTIFEENLYHLLALYRSIVLVRQLDDNLLGLNIDHLARGWIGPASV